MIDVVTDQTYQLKEIDLIDPSPLNPRKTFDQARLADLCASIKSAGVIEPLVVRPGKKDRVELVAGERRWRAAKMAGLTNLPIVVRSLTDGQVLTLMAIENEQRDDIHPLERAVGYQSLMKVDPLFTPETIAARIGKSKRWVQLCLQYLTLEPGAQEAFRTGRITAGHADLIVRLSPADQKLALAACFEDEWSHPILELGEKETKQPVLVSVRTLDDWIKQRIRLPLDAKSPQLDLLPEVQEAIAAADPVYHKDAPRLLELVDSHYIDPKVKPAPLTRHDWKVVKPGQKCTTQLRGVIVLGASRGRILTVCTGTGVCALHWPETIKGPAKSSATPSTKAKAPKKAKPTAAALKWERQQAERKVRADLWDAVRPTAVQRARAIVAKLKPTSAQALALLAPVVGDGAWMGKLPKKPTFTDLLGAIVEHAAEDSDFVFTDQIAKPLGIDLKPLFAAAAPKPAAKKTPTAKPAPAKKRVKLGKGKK